MRIIVVVLLGGCLMGCADRVAQTASTEHNKQSVLYLTEQSKGNLSNIMQTRDLLAANPGIFTRGENVK